MPWRGLQLLPDIYKQAQKDISDVSLEIYSGFNSYQINNETIEQYKESFNDLENVEFNEGIGQVELAKKLSTIEYLTYPCIFIEVGCITVLQAMACGNLILTSDLGNLRETMGGLNEYINVNQYSFNKEKYIEEYTNKLKQYLLLDDSEKKLLQQKNKEYIINNHLWANICKLFNQQLKAYHYVKEVYYNEHHQNLLNSLITAINEEKWETVINTDNNIKFNKNLNEYYIIKLNVGLSYYKLNNYKNAKKYFKLCLEIKNDFTINKNLALLELQQKNYNKFFYYAKAALLHEYNIDLCNTVAEQYELLGLSNESKPLYEKIISLEDTNINAYNNLGNNNLLRIAHLEDINKSVTELYYKALNLCQNDKTNSSVIKRKKELVLSNLIFNNLYNWNLSDEEIFNKSKIWYDYFPKEEELMNIVNKLDRKTFNKKIKVGYISADYLTHPVGFMFNSIIKNHNTDDFELYCYECNDIGIKSNDALAIQLRNYNNAVWKNFTRLSDAECLQLLVEDNLDILVDMMGHTRNTRINLLQYKPARIQISYFAYPSTNGLNEIDYRFTDKYATPEECDKYFCEKLYRLPNCFQCYTPPYHIEAIKDYTGRDKYNINLCCFNNPTKLSLPTIETFSKILKRLPNAKLFLRYCYYNSSYYKVLTKKLFTDRGVNEEQIDIGFLALNNLLPFYNKMDIVLDPFPYNGGTISSEAIYMNTPLITLKGTNYVSRVGTSLLSNLGLEKYIAESQEEYINKVLELANNKDELHTLHHVLRNKMIKSDLANSVNFTKNIENAYKDIISKHNI